MKRYKMANQTFAVLLLLSLLIHNMEPEFERAPTYSIPNRRFLCVEYPGAVKNIDRVLETLGGEKTISQVTRKT